MRKLIVVNNPKEWHLSLDNVEVVEAKQYLINPEFSASRQIQVFNLCRRYQYQSTGYYVSLLAEARGHRVIPSATTLNDFRSKNIIRSISDEIDEEIQRSLRRIRSEEFVIFVYFGKSVAQVHTRLARALYNLFQAPMLKAAFSWDKDRFVIDYVQPIGVHQIPETHKPYVEEFAKAYFAQKRYPRGSRSQYNFDLAILINPAETDPPSDKKALQHFKDAAESLDFYVDFITKDDFSRIGEYDALFIRETTAVNHHTYRFARKAASEGLVVVDDPRSILRCTNKVYLADLLARAHIRTPKTIIIHKDQLHGNGLEVLGFPLVLKKPDGSFSKGVRKVDSAATLIPALSAMFDQSDLLIAQEFMPTQFDWRVGVFNNKVLYVCKYYMAKGHWQIYNWAGKKKEQIGAYEAAPLSRVPTYVTQTALKAANLIGNGLYGVDLKEIDKKAFVIEINDNPSIDSDVEDFMLGSELYLNIMRGFKERLEASSRAANSV